MAETTQAVQAKPQRGMSKSLRDSLVAYSFIAPNFIGFCIFTLVPMIFAIGLSFCNWDGVHPVEFTGISNFVALLSDKTFKAAFVNTLVYAIGTVPLTLVCSLGLAMLLNQKVKFRNFFRTVSFFPYVASLVAVAAVWNMIFSPSMGPVNQILATLGVENLPKWAAGKDTAMLTVILFSVWKNMGYYMVIYLAGLQGTNPELEEAAELDGASKWQIFWNVTLPQLKPTTFFVIIMLTIASFKVYDQMYMITQGVPGNATLTLVYNIYTVAFVNTPKYGYASAVSMVLFVLVLACGMLFRQSQLILPQLSVLGFADSEFTDRRAERAEAELVCSYLAPDDRVFYVGQGDNGEGWFSAVFDFYPILVDYSGTVPTDPDTGETKMIGGGGELGLPELQPAEGVKNTYYHRFTAQ